MKPANVFPKSLSLDIQKLDISVYEDCIKEYMKRFSQHKGILWIGQFGFLTTPGISDIDLILVCDDEWCKDIALASEEFVTQSPLHRYLFIHQVYVVPHSGLKYVFYFHPLDNLLTLWGDSAILNGCEQADEMIRLFRAVLWNSSCWSKTLQFCQQDTTSLRSLLIRTKSLVTGTVHNHRLIGNGASAGAATQRVEEERQRILSADPGEQSDLARVSFWEAVQTLAKSDWDLNTWMIQEGLSDGYDKKKKLRLSEKQLIIFDDSCGFRQENFHQHFFGTHITYLPSFYYAIGFLVSQPYLHLEPSLSRLWNMRAAERFDNVNLGRTIENWNEAFWGNVKVFRRSGIPPLALDVYPYNVQRVYPIMIRLLRQVIPIKVRHWLRARLPLTLSNHSG